MPMAPSRLSHDDPKYISWYRSLAKRKPPWNRGRNKDNDPRVKRISETLKQKKLDNFSSWRMQMKREGKIISSYPDFRKNCDLAVLIGLILGDGNIHQFPRTQKLTLTFGNEKPELITFAANLVERVIGKKPAVSPCSYANATRITLYQQHLSRRLEVPVGRRRFSLTGVPTWIWKKNTYLLGCLKGLYEAEASLNIHLATCTYNFAFRNYNEKLLSDVKVILQKLGLHPEVRSTAIRLRRRDEVKYLEKLIRFRKYYARSANGRQLDSESSNLGSNPSLAANSMFVLKPSTNSAIIT